jgi:signal transduction histidine kinase/DNA-binding response OmpR family regulator
MKEESTDNLFSENEAIIDYLKNSRLFNHLPEERLKQLVPLSELSSIPAGKTILEEGKTNDKVYFLLRGVLGIYVDGEHILDLKRRGDIIGELSVISDRPCTATVLTKTPVYFFSIRARHIGTYARLDHDEVQNTLYRIFAMIMTDKLSLTTAKAKLFEHERRELKIAQGRLQEAYDKLDSHARELEIARREAESASRAKSEFLANMSHEIRTPLNAILGFSQLMTSLVTDEKQLGYLESIKIAGKSLLTLINDILDLSKIEAGMMEIRNDAVNLALLFHEIEQIFAAKCLEKGIDFIVRVNDRIPPALNLDEIRLRQVLLNLVGNAVKFTDKGHVILTVNGVYKSSERKRADLVISVEDTGFGIPENQYGAIFESFRQQSVDISKKYGGTGLGLSICDKLVRMMKGEILVNSEEGSGSVFTVWFYDVEVSSAAPEKQTAEALDVDEIVFDDGRVLVVDDVESNRQVLSAFLSKTALKALMAENGQEGILLAQEFVPDIIFMDIKMPGIDGLEATRRLRETETFAKTPIIALTAMGKTPEFSQDQDPGFSGYLTKPIDLGSFFKELMRFLPFQQRKRRNTDADTIELTALSTPIVRRAELIEVMESDITRQVAELKGGVMKISAVTDLGEQLIALGGSHGVSTLSSYGQRLLDYGQTFDIARIDKILARFPDLMALLVHSES